MDRKAIEHILGQIVAAESAQDDQERMRLLQVLAHQPDEALNTLQEILKEPDKDYWPAATEAIEAIGYPRNAAALPLLIPHAADPNSPASFIALPLLDRLPRKVLESELVAAFWPTSANPNHQGTPNDEWIHRVNAVCLVALNLGIQYCRILGPALIYFLSQPTYRQQLHPRASEEMLPWPVFQVLETIKEDLVPYGVLALLDVASEEKTRGRQGRAMALIRSFDAQVFDAYIHLPTFDPTILMDLTDRPER